MRMVGELVFVQRYVNAIVDGWDQAVIYVRFLLCNYLLSASINLAATVDSGY